MALQFLTNKGDIGLKAGGTIHEYTFVKISSDTFLAATSATETTVMGVSQTECLINDGVTIKPCGSGEISLLKLGSGGASAGQTLAADTNGYGVVDTTSGHEIRAIALETGLENEKISCLLVWFRY